MNRLRLWTLAYVSMVPAVFGWVAGLLCLRFLDGWAVAKSDLDRLDDATLDDIAKRKEQTP